MDWFRMYSEFSHDPKVQSMPEAMQRRLVMLLCMRCSNALVTLHETEIAFALRITEEELAETKVLFLRKGFVDESWEIMNWDKRQFISDSSAARVAKHRAAKKEGRPVEPKAEVTACNVTVTPQNRTDTEQIQNRADSAPIGAGDKSPPNGLTANEALFQVAVPWLVANGCKESGIRSLLGGAIKQIGAESAWGLASECMREKPMEPTAWLAAGLNDRISALSGGGRKANTKPSRHGGFDLLDYTEGVTADGRIA